MDKLEVALKFVLDYEGGYANDPNDRGGETFRGIARKSNPGWPGWGTIDQYKTSFPQDFRERLLQDNGLLEDVKQLYRLNYWAPINGDGLPGKYAVAAFDFAVNSGPVTAARLLQYSLGVHVDANIGPITVTACIAAGEQGLVAYLARRASFLCDFMMANPDQRMWALNWFKRLFRLANIVLDGQGIELA